ncbi:hypothetical protein M8J75_004995 [Diaphorina citri]|nr:hypothetical protein M8J75_004995 [Diaphorina citri]
MAPFNKQHLIFMPENGKSKLKFTKDLKVEDKHDINSCKSCSTRIASCLVNVQAVQIQNKILTQQRECSKLWNKVLDEVSKGYVAGNQKHASDLEDAIICIEDDIEDDEIEEIQTPTPLPTLSPIINIQPKKPNTLVNKTPVHSTTPVFQTSAESGININNVILASKTLHSQKFLDDSTRETYTSFNKITLLPDVKKSLIYTQNSMSKDHLFVVGPLQKGIAHAKKQLSYLASKWREALNNSKSSVASNFEAMLKKHEENFVSKHIRKIHFTDNLCTYEPMDIKVRNAIYDPSQTGVLFDIRSSGKQEVALSKLRQLKCNLRGLELLQNKFAPQVANELYYQEFRYRKEYLAPRHSLSHIPQPTPKEIKTKMNRLRRENKKSKSLEKKMRKRMSNKEVDEMTNITEITEDVEPTVNDDISSCELTLLESTNKSLLTPSKTTPVCQNKAIKPSPLTPKTSKPTPPNKSEILTPRSNKVDEGFFNHKPVESTPKKPAKFQPYKSLLDFSSINP